MDGLDLKVNPWGKSISAAEAVGTAASAGSWEQLETSIRTPTSSSFSAASVGERESLCAL